MAEGCEMDGARSDPRLTPIKREQQERRAGSLTAGDLPAFTVSFRKEKERKKKRDISEKAGGRLLIPRCHATTYKWQRIFSLVRLREEK